MIKSSAHRLPKPFTVRLSGGCKLTYTYRPRRYLSRLATILMIMVGAYPAQALDINTLPHIGSVSTGSAAIVQGDGRLDINQTTQNVSINWDSFNIGSNAQVNFHQPSSTSVALNRVIGSGGASEIFGHLTANGYVFLLNPNGVLFSQNAQVNVGGLVASTMGLSDSDFLAKRYNFVGNGSFSSVINQGLLTASEGGYIALLAPEVRNEGVITAYLGTVALGAGEQITLDFSGNRLVNLAVDQSAIRALIENRKMIQVDGGTVILAAKSEGDLSATVVNSEGIIQAQSIGNVSGVIRLEGGTQGVVRVAGILDTSGKDLGETGGSIQVLGDKVGLFAGSSIDASGDAGGGTVLVGGDFQGKNPNIQNASFSYVDQGAIINVDAIGNGNGGKVIVWANDSTRFYGGITAQGGSRGGDGGFAEVSGKQNLTFAGNANLGSLAGKSGTLLLDPLDLYVGINPGGGAVQDTSKPFEALTGTGDYYVLPSTFSNEGGTITLQAGHDVIFNANAIFHTDVNNVAYVIAANNIKSTGFSISMDQSVAGVLMLQANTMDLGAISIGSGTLKINNSGAATQSGIFSGTGGLTKMGAGTLTLSKTNTYTGVTTISAGTVSLSGNNKLANGSSLVVGGGTFDMNTRSETVNAVKLISGSITGTSGTLTSATTFDMQSGTVSAILTGAAGLTKTTAGTVTLSGTNTFTGVTTINAGVLSVATIENGGVAGNLGQATNAASNLILGGGTLQYTGVTSSTNRNFTLTSGTTTTVDVTNSNNLTLAGASTNTTGLLNKVGTGTVTLSGLNLYTGLTTVSAGTLAYGINNALSTGAINVSGGTFSMGTFSDTVGTVTLASGSITGTTGVLTGTSYAMQSGTASAILGGTGALTKTTAGTVILSGLNLYTGLTTVSAGTLSVTNSTALGSTSGTTTVLSGATLDINNVAVGLEAITLNGTGVSAGGALTGTGTASLTGPITLASGSSISTGIGNTLTVGGTINGAFSLDVTGSGSVNLSGSVGDTTALASFSGSSGVTLAVNGGLVKTSGSQLYNGPTTLGGTTTLQTAGGDITATGAMNATAGVLTISSGVGSATFNNTSNNFGTVQVTSGGAVSLVDSNAMTVGSSVLSSLIARTITGDLTLGGNITATGGGDSIVLAAGSNFNNTGSFTLTPGTGRWLVYTSDPAAAIFGGLSSGNLALWNQNYVSNPSSNITQTGNRYLFGTNQTLTFTSGSLTKIYGDNVTSNLPTLYTFSGANSNTYGGVIIADSSVALSSLFSGGVGVSSSGGVSSANVSGSPYAVTVSSGTLSNLTGYGTAFISTGSITVNPYAVSLSGTRIYDGSTTASSSIFSLGSLVGSETLVLSGSGTVVNKNVGAGKAVSLGSLALGNGSGLASNYTFTGGTQLASIAARSLTISAAGVDRTYDGTTSATVTLTDNRVSGDVLTDNSSTVSFDTKNVGTNKAVTASGLSLAGLDVGNYTLANATAATTAAITTRALTINAAGVNRTYDGTTSATVTLTDNRVSGDSFTDSYTSASFLTKDAALGKSVTATGLNFSGADAGNYTLSSATAATTASIAARSLTISATGVDRTYDGTTSATVTLTDNRVVGDTFTDSYTNASFLTKDAALGKSVTATGLNFSGADAGNYTLANATAATTANIAARSLTISATGVDRTYDGSVVATVTLGDNRVSGDSFTDSYTNASFLTKDAALGKSVAATGLSFSGADAGNYTLANATAATTANIAARSLTISATGVDRTYDGSVVATVTLGDNRVSGDSFTDSYASASFSNKNAATGKSVTATGLNFSGTDAGNYTLSSATAATTASIAARSLTISAAGVDRTYDGTTSATVTLTDNRVVGDTFTDSYTNASFLTKDAALGKSVTATGLNFSGADAGNYTLANATAATTANIAARSLTISATGVDRTYDGSVVATVTLGDNRVSGDSFTDSYTNASFLTKDAALGKSVAATGLSFSGADAGNYTLANATAATTANIAARSLTISATGVDRTYDGSVVATVTLGDNRVSGDSFTDSYTNASFLTKDAALGKSVAATGLSFSGADAGNYTLANATAATTANIAARSLTISATGVDRTYDGSVVATVTLGDNRVSGDSFTDSYASASFSNKNAATGKSVTATGLNFSGTDAGNYTLSSATAATTASIAARSLTISAAGVDRTYDGTTSATVTLTDNRVVGDTFTDSYTNASFLTKDAALGKSVTATGLNFSGADAGNYTLSSATAATTAAIAAKSLTISAAGVNRTYDGTTSATVTLSDNRVVGDTFTDSYTSASFLTKDAALGKSVTATGLSFSGVDAGNYTLSSATAATTAAIAAKSLTISAAGVNRTYDGTTSATVTLSDNRVVGDTFTDSYTSASFLTKDAALGKSVTATGLNFSGADAGNYTLANATAATTANIAARSLTISATGVDRTYDGSVVATVTLGDNRVSGDSFTDSYTSASFLTKGAALGKSVTASGLSLAGIDAGNYTLANATATTTAAIAARALIISATGVDRTYDGSAVATVTLSDNRVSGDLFTDSYTRASFLTKDAATDKSVAATGLSFSGTDAGNYILSNTTASTMAAIAAKALTISATGVSRIYDRSTVATVTLSDDRVSGDTFTDSYTSASFLTKDAGSGKSVTATGFSFSGVDAGNYTLANSTVVTTASIAAKSLTISAAGVNRTYDGSVVATVTLGDNRVSGDSFTDSYTNASFLTKDAALGKSVAATGLSFSGADAGNYTLANATAATTANIAARSLTISATGVDRTYDGSVVATVTLGDNRVSGDSFTDSYASASFSNKNAATGKSVTATGLNFSGTDAGNYTLSSATAATTASIAARSLTISAAGVDRTYDGSVVATVTLGDNRVSGDSFTDSYTNASFLTKDAALGKSVAATGLSFSGADAGNYTLANATAATTANIAARSLTISATGVDRTYDGSVVATVTLGDNRVSGDSFTDSYASASFSNKNAATGKSVTATGLNFSGTDAGNYTLSSATAATTASIAARSLTISAAGVDRTYDGTTSATVTLTDNRVVGDTFTDSYTNASFLTKDAALGKSVTATGLNFSGADAGNYTLSSATAATTAAIAAKSLTISAAGVNRTYDGTTSATVTLSDNRVVGDTFTDSYTSASFLTKDAALGKSVTATGLSFSGVDAGNYTLSSATAATTAAIAAKSLTISAAGVNRTYDGTTSATVTLSDNRVVGDTFTDSYTSASFLTKDAALGKSVTATGLSFSGADAGNYTLSSATAATTAAIAAKSLTISAAGVNRTYDGTTSATVTLSDNRVVGDTFTDSYTSASFLTKGAALGKSVTASGLSLAGIDAGNYTLANATATTTAAIAARALIISATGVDRTYDGSAVATVTLSDNRVSGDLFTDSYTRASFLTKDAATDKSVAATGLSFSGTDAGNYILSNTTASTMAAIAAKALTISATGVSRIYDRSTVATVTLSDDRVSGDTFTDSYTSASFLTKDAGSGKSVTATGFSFSGVDAGNYTLANSTVVTTASIAAKSLTISAAGVNRSYDGTNLATVMLNDNRVAGDVVTDNYIGALFLTKDVGIGKSVTATGLSIGGDDASNYTLENGTVATSANIVARELSVIATGLSINASGVSRIYDGTTAATITLSDNRVAGDVINDNYIRAYFQTKDVGFGKIITAEGLSLSGVDADNYMLNSTTIFTTADISARTLLISAAGVNRTYDGTTAATVTLSDNRVVGDTFTDSYTSASFLTKDAALGKSVTATGLGFSGVDAGNYILSNSTADSIANIAARALIIGAAGVNRTYDGTTLATVTLSDNRVAGDTFTDSYTSAAFLTKDAATGKLVTASGLSLAGLDAGNYTLSSATAATTATIAAKSLTINAAGVNRTYDGTTAATVTLSDNRIAGDSFTDSYTSASFLTKGAALGKVVTATGLSFSGVDAGNYTLSSATAATTASIAARSLTISAAGVNRTYDGTTAATVTLSDNRVSGDVLTDNSSTVSFDTKNVGTNKAVTASGLSLTGLDAGNYTLTNATAATTASIAAKSLTISAAGVNRTYDGTTAATVTLSDNRVSGDVLTDNSSTVSFDTKNVGTNKAVTASGLSLAGVDAGNYTLSSATAATTASIAARSLTISAAGVDRTYDGTTSATVTLSDNRVVGDTFTDSYTNASFLTKDAALGKSVAATGLSFSGADAGNYTLSSATAATTASIAARSLTISAAGVDRIYDGTTSATVTLTDNRVVGDTFTDSYTSASFLTKDAALGKAVTATGLSFSGVDAGNYALAISTAETTADIKPIVTASNNNALLDSSVGMTANLISIASPQSYFESVSQPTRISVDPIISVRPILIPEQVRINRSYFRDFAPVPSPLID